MGNVFDSFFTGFFHSIGNFFGSPLEFLSGKSCSTVCPSPWDFICYVENFCVANLAKAALILILSYLFLFFIYMLYKVGFWHCIIHGLCRIFCAFVSCWSYILSNCCTFFCYNLLRTKRRRRHRHRRYIVEEEEESDDDDDDEEGLTDQRSRRECRREERLRKSLRPRSHRVRVGVRKDHRSVAEDTDGNDMVHGVRVSRESKFARKGSNRRTRTHRAPRRARFEPCQSS